MGLMQTEIINITAEAYDVAMDISFPRGWYMILYQPPCSSICTCMHMYLPLREI